MEDSAESKDAQSSSWDKDKVAITNELREVCNIQPNSNDEREALIVAKSLHDLTQAHAKRPLIAYEEYYKLLVTAAREIAVGELRRRRGDELEGTYEQIVEKRSKDMLTTLEQDEAPNPNAVISDTNATTVNHKK